MKRAYAGYDNRPFKRVRGVTYAPVRVFQSSRPVPRIAQRRFQRRRMVVPGYTRSAGGYNRYRGPGAELKFFDTAISATIPATGTVITNGQISLIPQGDTSVTRDGRQASIRSIQLKARAIYSPGASAEATGSTYFYLVLDKQCNGAAATGTDVFTSASFDVGMINLDNSDRFVILKKWQINWNPPAGNTGNYNDVSRHVDLYKKCNIPMTWSGTTGAITEIRSNNLFIMGGCTPLLDGLTNIVGTARLRFQG